MYSLLLSSLPLLAQVLLANAAQSTDDDKRDLVCFQVEASTIFLPTTVYVTISSKITANAEFVPVGGATITSLVTLAGQASIVPETPQQAVIQLPDALSKQGKQPLPQQPPQPTLVGDVGFRWSNNTKSSNGTAGLSETIDAGGVVTTVKLPTVPRLGKVAKPTAAIQYNHRRGASRNALYFGNWGIYGANNQPQDVPVDKITHMLYAFADIKEDGSVVSSDPYADVQKRFAGDSLVKRATNAYGVINQLFKMKKRNRNLKTLLSIGGFTYSQQGKFSRFAGSQQGRRQFASSAVKLLADWGMDGLDIDWEHPQNAAEAQHLTALLAEVRAALDNYAAQNSQKYHYLLTVASSAGQEHYNKLDLKAMDRYVDAWHLMAYDYAGTWDETTGHQANLRRGADKSPGVKFSTDQAVDDYARAGVSASKIVLGIPLYGRSFGNTDGLGRPFAGSGKGARDGVVLYRDLDRPGASVEVDGVVGAAWSYDPKTRELVSYDNAASTKLKAEYVQSKGLGGAVFWEASGDKKGDGSLVGTMARALGDLDQSTNMLSYPQSRYDNIRNDA